MEFVVSIVTVNYNGAKTLPRLLKSVSSLLNENVDFEHWIIDGESNDDSIILLREYVASHENAFLISERDGGIYDAMNKGISNSRGAYIIHLNSDDKATDINQWNTVRQMLRDLAPQVLTSPVPIKNKGRTIRILPAQPYSKLHRKFGYHFPHQGTFFARNLFDNTNGYNTSIGYIADKIFCYCLLDHLKNEQIVYTDKNIAVQYAGGISSSTALTPLKTLVLAIKSKAHVRYRNPWIRAMLNPLFKIIYKSKDSKLDLSD